MNSNWIVGNKQTMIECAYQWKMVIIFWGFFIYFYAFFCPGTMTNHAESINSDLQRGLDRRLRQTQH